MPKKICLSAHKKPSEIPILTTLAMSPCYAPPEVGKVTFKSNGDEALSFASLLKSNNGEASNDDFP
jgi:hypothetical protein